MTDRKLTDLSTLTSLADGDLVYVVDVSDTTDSPQGSSKTATIGSLQGAISVKSFGAVGDGVTDDTAAIQSAIDEAIGGDFDLLFPRGTYLVSKQTSLSNYPGSDQPCLEARSADSLRICGYGAKLTVAEHAQGILELQLCDRVVIEGLEFEGPANFPGLDGTTGRAEKGTASAGFNTTTAGIWGFYKNNSNDTSANTGGGYSGNFPQFGGGTDTTWNTWNGGFIGNVAYGLLIHNGCSNITVRDCKSTGFNYLGFGVGHPGDYSPVDRGYADNTNIRFERCIGTNNYSAGIHTMAVEGYWVKDCVLNNNGHPDSLTTDDAMDPGYGWTNRLTTASQGSNGKVIGNTANGNKRKGLDNHGGVEIIIDGNEVEGNGTTGIFSDWSASSDADLESTRIVITNNRLKGNAIGPAALGGVYINGPGGSGQHVTTICANNTFKDSAFCGIRVRYASGVTVANNVFTGSASSASTAASFIDVFPNDGGGATDESVLITGNNIFDDDNELTRGIYVLDNYEHCLVSNNIIRMEGASVVAGIEFGGTTGCHAQNNTVYLGSAGTPLAINQTDGRNFGNQGFGGASSSNLLPNTKEGALPRDCFSFRVDMNDLSISRRTATDIVGTSATSQTTGFSVAFTGLSSVNDEYTATWAIASSGGLVNGGTSDPFIYLRAISNTAIEIGLKDSAGGSDLAGVDFTSGELDIVVWVV